MNQSRRPRYPFRFSSKQGGLGTARRDDGSSARVSPLPSEGRGPGGEAPSAGGIITAIEPQRRRGRYNVYVDGEFALALDPEILAAGRLSVGSVIGGNRLLDLAAQDLNKRALDAALRLLSYRPRSEHELRTRLARLGLPHDVIVRTIDRLRELGYVNDAAFARSWVESRAAGSPRGARLLRRELSMKGVAVELAAEVSETTDELEGARQAAAKKARSLRGLDYPTFRNRLAGYLQRRGFGYDVIKPVVRELWGAQGQPAAEDDIWEE